MYTKIRKLGKGAFGETFLVEKNGTEFVMKELSMNRVDLTEYNLELNALQKISKHHGVCDSTMICLVDHFIDYDNQKFILITNYLQNSTTLSALLKDKYIFTLKDIKFVMYYLLEQLHFLHDYNIVHGDIKPENIIIQQGENFTGIQNVMFIDFGISCIKRCKPGGTMTYLAPELLPEIGKKIFINKNEYKKTDIWSLGLVFYQIANGKLPFEDELKNSSNSMAIMLKLVDFYQTTSVIPSDYDNDVVSKTIKMMLEISPRHRPSIHRVFSKFKQLS